MAKTPQSFEKRQRERRKLLKRQEKLERRLERHSDKKDKKDALPPGEILPLEFGEMVRPETDAPELSRDPEEPEEPEED